MSGKEKTPLDHLVYGVPDLAEGVEEMADFLGVRPSPGGSHPGWGTANALLSLGPDSYLEIIGPDPEQPEPEGARPFGLDGLAAPGWVAWAVKVPEIDAGVAEARRRGYDPGPVRAMGRRRPDGSELAWRLALPPRWRQTLGGLVPFPIDWGESPHPGADAATGLHLLQIRAQHPRPAEVRHRLAALGVSLEVREAPSAGLGVVLETPRGTLTLGDV